MPYTLSDKIEIIDLGWPWRPLSAIVAKRCGAIDHEYEVAYWISNDMEIIDLERS